MPEQLAFNMDCLEAMRQMEDNAFDLAVVDPPYGNGLANGGGCRGWFDKYQPDSQSVNVERERESGGRGLQAETGKYKGAVVGRFGGAFERYIKDRWNVVNEVSAGTTMAADIRDWDVKPPDEYFEQLARVSKNQIIFGANYFNMPPTRCFIVWRKSNIPLEGFSMAPVEYAWTSFFQNAAMFECYSSGGSGRESRFHPTQKPVQLYKWILSKYAKPGDKILDTHLGSGSSRIAAYDLGFDFVGYEIDKFYFDKQEERFAKHTAQLDLFH